MQNPRRGLTKQAITFAATLAAAQMAGAGDGSGTRIIIGMTSAMPGERTSVAVMLETDVQVAGTQNDMAFTPPVRIGARANGRPDCRINPELSPLGGVGFAFLPTDCDPATTCTGVRALVLPLSRLDGIPDGSLLYTCEVEIPADTPGGTYPLEISNVGAADLDGNSIAATGTSGAVIVEAPTPTPTHTPPATATPTVTPRPSSAEDDGCAISGSAPDRAWWLLAPLIVALARRRRRRMS